MNKGTIFTLGYNFLRVGCTMFLLRFAIELNTINENAPVPYIIFYYKMPSLIGKMQECTILDLYHIYFRIY